MLIKKNVVSGFLFLGIGVIFIIANQKHGLGNASNMGPGYFPALLSIILSVIGVALIIQGFLDKANAEEVIVVPLPTIITVSSIVMFGLLLETVGLAVTTLICVLFSRLAVKSRVGVEDAIFSIMMASFVSFLFVYVLSIPMPLWPAFI